MDTYLLVTLEDMDRLDAEMNVALGYMTFAEMEEYQAEYDAWYNSRGEWDEDYTDIREWK